MSTVWSISLKSPATEYIRFFIKQKKLGDFFGREVLSYIAAMLLLCIVGLWFQGSFAKLQALPRALMLLLLVGTCSGAMVGVLSNRFSIRHNDYLKCLGFKVKDLRFLVRVTAFPLGLIHAFLIPLVVVSGYPHLAKIVVAVSLFIATEASCPYLVRAHKKSTQRTTNKKIGRTRNFGIKPTFRNAFLSFFTKDLLEARLSEVLSVAMMMVIGFAIFLVASLGNSLQSFCLGLYVGAVLIIYPSGLYTFMKEQVAYHKYYVPLLKLSDFRILIYKLPFQVAVLFCVVLAFLSFQAVLFGLDVARVISALGIFAYCLVLVISMSWLYLKRIKTKKGLDSLFQLIVWPFVMVPGLPILCFVVSLVLDFRRTGLKQVK